MPTGYTAAIKDGATFEQFVWSCARAFGAFVMQRDDASDAPPVLNEKPSKYEEKRLKEALAEQKRLGTLTDAQWRQEWETYRDETNARNVEQNAEYAALEEKYRAMLARVRDWTPPTKDHAGLKKFMVEQIEESIKFDCDPIVVEVQPFDEWKQGQIADAAEDIIDARKSLAEEVERVAKRNKWKADLMASVPLPETVSA